MKKKEKINSKVIKSGYQTFNILVFISAFIMSLVSIGLFIISESYFYLISASFSGLLCLLILYQTKISKKRLK